MKKLFLLLTMGAMLATACTEGGSDESNNPQNPTEQPGGNDNPEDNPTEDPDTPPQEEPIFEIDSEGNYIVEASGGVVEVRVATNLEYTVNIPEDAKLWLSVADTRAIRNETLTFTVAKNENNKERQTAVSIKGINGTELQSIIFKQKNELTDDSILISEGKVCLDFEGGECALTVKAPYSWVATCSAEWITLNTPNGIAGEEPLLFIVKRNTTLEERKATITLKTENYNHIQELYVIQTEFAPTIEIVESVSLDCIGEEKFIKVTSNVEYEVTDDAYWLNSEKTKGGIKLSASGNVTYDTRRAVVTISAKENAEAAPTQIMISQNSGADFYSIIYYTSSDGKIIKPYENNVFGANIIGNRYENGQGILAFDRVVTSIGDAAFYDCESLTSVTIPDTVTSIGDYAFYGCKNLTNITIPDTVTSIGDYALVTCISLESVRVKISDLAEYCDGNQMYKIPGAKSLYMYGKRINYLDIPDSVTSIGDYAFQDSALLGVTIGDSVTSIGDAAFQSSTLYDVTIGDNVTSIGEDAFRYCNKLTSVTIPKRVRNIGRCAFAMDIDSYRFKTVYCRPSTPPSVSTDSFDYKPTIYVPKSCLGVYQIVSNWRFYSLQPYDFE